MANVNVPNLIGLPIAQAFTQLTAAGLQGGTTTVSSNNGIAAGNVISHIPVAGNSVAGGTAVDIEISSGPSGWKQFLSDNFQSIVFNVFAGGLLIFFAVEMANKGQALEQLKDRDTARGLITFLITATAAGLFIIMAISTIVLSRGTDDDKRFDRGKQILTMLIGILGTIVGFYFGSVANSAGSGTNVQQAQSQAPGQVVSPSGTGQSQALKIADAKVNPPEATKNQKVVISAVVLGGKPPYTYTISFNPPLNIVPVKDKKPADGKIIEQVTVPGDLQRNTEVSWLITVTDSETKTAVATGDRKLLMKVE